MPLRLIIFDLDGTLIDSLADITCAVNHAFAPYDIEPVSEKEAAGMVGEGTLRLIEKVLVARNLDLDTDALMRRFVEHYSSHPTDHTKEYAQTTETLLRLGRYRKAVVSNKLSALSVKILDDLGLSAFFDLVVGGDTLPERKPSSAPLLHVLSALNITPEEAIMVGDSSIDMEAGRAASVRIVAATYGYGKNGFWEDADFVIRAISELIGITERIS
jgi:phosphoglycolate phosphatase